MNMSVKELCCVGKMSRSSDRDWMGAITSRNDATILEWTRWKWRRLGQNKSVKEEDEVDEDDGKRLTLANERILR